MTADNLTLMASVGNGGVNRPDDVDRIKERLLKLGYPGIIRFRDTTLVAHHSGFLNDDRMLQREGFYWGTSWFADTLVRAGQHYWEHYLKEHPYAAPIPVNDVSRQQGRDNCPHTSHDTGLAVDLPLPLTSGRWGGVTFLHAQYDRTAMEGIIDAFASTGMVKEILFNDSMLVKRMEAKYQDQPNLNPGMLSLRPCKGHDNHLHLSIKPSMRGRPIATQIALNGSVGRGVTATEQDLEAVRQRLRELGFSVEGDDKFLYAIELFQAAVRGMGSPQKVSWRRCVETRTRIDKITGCITPDSDDLKWLNAENAPLWQKIPAGTVEVFEDKMSSLKGQLSDEGAQFDDVVGAIRLFQSVINGLDAPADDPNKADGAIDPNRNTHGWLSAPNAPGWVKLQQPAGYELVQALVQAGDVHTSTWLTGVLISAASPPGLGITVQIAAVRASSCDIVLPVGANGSLDAAAAQAIIDRFKAVTEPATAELRCHPNLMASLTGCQPDDKVSDKHLRVRVQPPQRANQHVPVDRPPVVHLQPPNPQRPSLCLVPGLTAADGEPLLGLFLPSPPDGDDQGNLGIRLPLQARPHAPITGGPGTPVQIKPGPAETLPYPTITPLTLPDLTFDLIPSVQPPQVLMAPTVEETPAPVPGLRVKEASLSLKENGANVHLVIDLEADVPGLLRLWRWRYELNQPLDALTGLWYAGQRYVGDPEEVVDWAEGCWLCAQFAVEVSLADLGLPLLLGPQATQKIVVRIGVSPEKQLDIELTGEITGHFSIDLGSPLARLDLNASGLRFSLSTFGGFSVTLPERVTAGLHLDLFDRFGDGDAAPVVNNIWSHAEGQAPWLLNLECQADLSQLGAAVSEPDPGNAVPQPIVMAELVGQTAPVALVEEPEVDDDAIDETEGATPHELTWQDGSPLVDPELLSSLVAAVARAIAGNDSWVNQTRQMLAFSGELPVLGNQMRAAFTPPTKPAIQFDLAGRALLLRLGMGITGSDEKTILAGEGEFRFVIDADETGMAMMQPGALRMSRGDVILQTSTTQDYQLGELLSLHIPGGSRFRFSCDPKDPQLAWDADESRKNTDARITLSVPAQGDGFTFEMESFRIHSAGIDLRGAVRTDSVALAGAQFAGPVGVKGVQRNGQQPADPNKPRPHQIGEIEFKNSRLVYGSLQASAKLPYFDDAVGTLTLFLSQGEDQSLACAGTLDISGIDEFHIDQLFATVQVGHLQLGVRYANSSWSSKASLTGRVKFQPPQGRSANEMGMLSSLFDGVVLDFEDLDPLTGKGAWKLTTPPKRFNIADVLLVDLRGLNIELEGALDADGKDTRKLKSCQLLGDITIQELPGIDSSLTFGGITLTPKGKGKTPGFTISRIAAQFSAPGGFSMSGELENISTEQETGFAGGFTLKMSALPELGGILKLTRVRLTNGKVAPSLALFVEYAAEVPLLYGFYLRRLGIGLGVRQALRGLEPDSPIPADQRLVKFIDNPAGLPDPIFASSWRPVQRPQLSWMLVGAGLITFGNLGDADPHLIAGSFLLSLDQDLRLILGTNLWLFTTPDETRNAEFLQRPVARGGMEISVGNGYLKTYLRTIKGPKLGKKAPPLLAEVLNSVETSLFFQADRNGFITEVGWPWETRIEYNKGDYFHGALETGYRYGFYRGVLVYALNFGIDIRLHASQTLSFGVRGASADASLEVDGAASFRASFVGALDTSDFRGYLMGDVRLDAMISVTASANVRIKISKWIKIRISFSATLDVAISAALTAAMDSGANIGFRGEARVAISICGYGIAGNVGFAYKPDVITDVQAGLAELLPPNMLAGQQGEPHAAALGADETPNVWRYRFCWLDDPSAQEPDRARLRILLFPSASTPYPHPVSQTPEGENPLSLPFGLSLKNPEAQHIEFKGFVGSTAPSQQVDNLLTWSQALSISLELGSDADHEQEGRAYLEERRAYHEALQKRLAELNARHDLSEGLEKERAEKQAEWNNLTGVTPPGDNEVEGVLDALKDVRAALDDKREPPQTLGSLLKKLGDGHPLAGSIADPLIDPDHDTKLAQAFNNSDQEEQQLGLLLAELLNLLKDSNAKPGEAASGYRAAHLMNLVLEFAVPAGWRQHRDPVPDLIDLDTAPILGIKQAEGEQNKIETRLESVLGRNAPPVEYDLIPLPVRQEPGRIYLAWDFLREDEAQGSRQGAGSDDFAPYAELVQYTITRFNVKRPGDRPRVVATQPAWVILEQGGQTFYIRPPFQFLDDHLEEITEGDFLQYRVEAHATDRMLASTLINVTRKTEKPLPIVGQTLAFHRVPTDGGQTITFIIPAWDAIKAPISASQDEAAARGRAEELAKIQAAELRIQHRSVPAAHFGAYGYDLRPTSPMRWVDGLPARREDKGFPRVKFGESSESRPLPWEETDALTGAQWTPITVVHYDPDAGGEVVEVVGFTCELPAADWPRTNAGQAFEFYIGRLKAKADTDPEERSPLTRCRHAVAAAAPESWLRRDDTQDVYTLDLSPGNTVDAFEALANPRAQREFLDLKQMQLAVAYPEPQPVEEGKPEMLQPPEIVLTWRHDRTEQANGDAEFNPVIGYRVHCFDRYDPGEYPALTDRGVVDRTLVTVRAIPERLYRATPESIVVEGVPIGTPDVSATTVDQKVQRMLEEAKTGKFRANWAEIEQVQLASSTNSTIPPLDSVPSGGPLLWEAAPIYLSSDLVVVLTGLCRQLGDKVRCRLIIHQPLEQRFRVEEVTAAALRSLVENLTVQFSERSDPFGWGFAEALGMSCECHFLDADDVPIPAERVRDTIVAHELGAPATVCFFRAADDRTLLNVVRLIGGAADAALHKRALVCRLTAKPPKGADVNPDPLENWPNVAEVLWPQDLPLAWQDNPAGEGAVYLPQRVKGDATPFAIEFRHDIRTGHETSAPIASVELPIAADGTLTYRWQAPDLWSHRYGVAIELVRRHDALWRLLRSEPAADQTPTQDPAIPATHLKEVIVDRTRQLVPHNLIVTPLPGSIQALVFRHPAAFAAAASAINATHGQYAGQTVILERRIHQRKQLVDQYKQFFGENGANYRPHQATESSAPEIWPSDEEPRALQPVAGTEPGIYGADRYVYPDLPGYYQYRVAAYSAAGRAQSPLEVSGWVDPIYDEVRQRPSAIALGEVAFDGTGVLTMNLPLVHPAYHLRDEVRALWRDADETIADLGDQRFGDLPDLFLTYQLYIRTNPLSENTAVFVPLCRLVGPMARSDANPLPDQPGLGFSLENQTPGADIGASFAMPGDQHDTFRLVWSITANLTSATDPSLLAGLRTADSDRSRFVAVAVQRRGVWSQLLDGSGEPLDPRA